MLLGRAILFIGGLDVIDRTMVVTYPAAALRGLLYFIKDSSYYCNETKVLVSVFFFFGGGGVLGRIK